MNLFAFCTLIRCDSQLSPHSDRLLSTRKSRVICQSDRENVLVKPSCKLFHFHFLPFYPHPWCFHWMQRRRGCWTAQLTVLQYYSGETERQYVDVTDKEQKCFTQPWRKNKPALLVSFIMVFYKDFTLFNQYFFSIPKGLFVFKPKISGFQNLKTRNIFSFWGFNQVSIDFEYFLFGMPCWFSNLLCSCSSVLLKLFFLNLLGTHGQNTFTSV